jgi:hypothetical protein
MVRRAPALNLKAKFRAVSRELRARWEGARASGRHSVEKGLRTEGALREFLARLLPPQFGVSRGEVVSAAGEVSRQMDVVIYDAHHSPLLEESEASRVFPAESVYAVIEVKPELQPSFVAEVVRNIGSAKVLDRSSIVAEHGGHRIGHGRRQNPPIFGAVFAFEGGDPEVLGARLHQVHARLARDVWVDCVCVLDKAVIYHFAPSGKDEDAWAPASIGRKTLLGYWDAGEDALLVFYLLLMHQLNARDLFPPDLHRYVAALGELPAKVYVPFEPGP